MTDECTMAERNQAADQTDVVLQVLHKPTSLEETTYGDVRKLASSPHVWQYQPPVSIQALRQYLENKRKNDQSQYELLSAFIQQVQNRFFVKLTFFRKRCNT